tara:strand:+ start:100 stop:291 length:192 start_codon:yes stop_codon:yes gene_type:complete
MTKKHYIKLVELIRNNTNNEVINPNFVLPKTIIYINFVNDLTTYLKEDNPNFNTATFIEALEK